MPRHQRIAPARLPAPNPLLSRLIQAVVTDDASEVSKLIENSPGLASQCLAVGATREAARDFYFQEIEHYLYAGDTPLHASAAGYRRDIAKELLKSGANVAAVNRRGATALHYAADGSLGSRGWNPKAQAEMIAFLIHAGADPNVLDKSGVAPLHRAVRQRCPGAVDSLLRHGAAVRLKNGSGSTPLHLAVQNTGRGGTGSPESKILQRKIIELLLKSGADPKDRDGRGKTVFQCAHRDWIALLDLKTEII
jgi:Ankyrin repeats (3 copies)/Ankyrin repeat